MKTKRQGLRVTIGQLRRIADELEEQLIEHNKQLRIKEDINFNQSIIIGIENKEKTPDGEFYCDTWRLCNE